MKNWRVVAKGLAMGLLSLAWLSEPAEAKLRVVATLPDLAAIAQSIGGDKVEVSCLALPTEDPHFVDPKPSFLVKLNRADALVEGGAELESGWLPALREKTRNQKIASGAAGDIKGSAGIELLQIPGTLDRSRGDIHAAGNPHYLTDPANAKRVAATIANAYCQIDPISGDMYRSNLKAFTARLDAKLAEWEKVLGPYKGAHLASYHDSWPYFAQRFGFSMNTFLEPKPGIPPSPAHLAEVSRKMKGEKIKVILMEPYLNRRTAESVARENGAVVLQASSFPGGVRGTEKGYIEAIDNIVTSLARILEGSGK